MSALQDFSTQATKLRKAIGDALCARAAMLAARGRGDYHEDIRQADVLDSELRWLAYVSKRPYGDCAAAIEYRRGCASEILRICDEIEPLQELAEAA